MKYYASVSFGKDSLAMLFMLIDKGYQLDEVVFYDTGMEFQAIYNDQIGFYHFVIGALLKQMHSSIVTQKALFGMRME